MFLVHIGRLLPWPRLIKFIITGGVALTIDVTVYYALTRFGGVYYLLARTTSLGAAIIWNFTVNRYWTFEATGTRASRQIPRFLTVIISTSLLSLGIMKIGVSILHLHDLLVLFIASVITTLINFSAHSLWSYATEKTTEQHSTLRPLS